MAAASLAEDDGLVYIHLGEHGMVQLDGGRAVPLPNMPLPVLRSDFEAYQGTQELPVDVLVEGTLQALVRQGRASKAAQYRRFLFTVEPNLDQLLVAQALTLAREGQVERARSRFEALVHLCPDHAVGWMNLGLCCLDMARRWVHQRSRFQAEALNALRAAVELDDQLAYAHFYLGCLHRDRGEHAEARGAWRRCVGLCPREDEISVSARHLLAQFEERRDLDHRFEQGCLAVLEGDPESASSMLERVVTSRPGCWEAAFFLGLARRQARLYEEAAAAFLLVLESRPDESEAWHELGLCELELGRLDAAEASLERALELAGQGDARLLCDLGMLRLRQGRSKDARTLFLAAQALDPQTAMCQEYLQLVEDCPQ